MAKFLIEKLVPQLYFIKKSTGGEYQVYLNYDWDWGLDGPEIRIIKEKSFKYPRLFATHNTYSAAKKNINYYISNMDLKYKEGLPIRLNIKEDAF